MAVCIRKRGKSYSAYWREGGGIKEVTLGRDYQTAMIKRGEIEKRLFERRNGMPMTLPWDDFKEKYLANSAADHSPDTILRNRGILKTFAEATRIKYLADLTPELLETYKGIRKAAGALGSTINRELSTIKSAVKKAGDWGYATQNLKSVKRAPVVKNHPGYFTEQEVQSILKIANPLWKTFVHLGFYAGLRRNEILHLEWPHVDFNNHFLKIRSEADWHPKDKGDREVPLHPQLEERLRRWRRVSSAQTKIIPWNLHANMFSLYFARLLRRASIQQGSLHTLRHSFASHLATQGVDLNKIKEMLGHASIQSTQIYTHLLPSSLREAVMKIPSVG